MKLDKEDKRTLIICSIFAGILIVGYFVSMYLLTEPFVTEHLEYSSLLTNVFTMTYGLALSLYLFILCFFLYLKFFTDKEGKPLGEK